MKFKIPFFRQTNLLNCGSATLKMVLDYFSYPIPLEKIERRMKIKEGKGIYTTQIAYASKIFGFKTEFYTKSLNLDKEHSDLEFYKKYGDNSGEKWIKETEKIGVKIQEKGFELKEILNKISRKSVAIVLVDWNIILGKEEKGYQGHFVPIVGYNQEGILIHNSGLNDGKPNMRVKKEIFDKARKAKGTDEDIVFIYRK
jgi:hypothetical protein